MQTTISLNPDPKHDFGQIAQGPIRKECGLSVSFGFMSCCNNPVLNCCHLLPANLKFRVESLSQLPSTPIPNKANLSRCIDAICTTTGQTNYLLSCKSLAISPNPEP